MRPTDTGSAGLGRQSSMTGWEVRRVLSTGDDGKEQRDLYPLAPRRPVLKRGRPSMAFATPRPGFLSVESVLHISI